MHKLLHDTDSSYVEFLIYDVYLGHETKWYMILFNICQALSPVWSLKMDRDWHSSQVTH